MSNLPEGPRCGHDEAVVSDYSCECKHCGQFYGFEEELEHRDKENQRLKTSRLHMRWFIIQALDCIGLGLTTEAKIHLNDAIAEADDHVVTDKERIEKLEDAIRAAYHADDSAGVCAILAGAGVDLREASK